MLRRTEDTLGRGRALQRPNWVRCGLRLLLAGGLAAATLAPHAAADTTPPPPAPDPNPPAGVAPDPYTPPPKAPAPVVHHSYVPRAPAVTHYTPRRAPAVTHYTPPASTGSSVVRRAVVAHPRVAAPTRRHVKRRVHATPHKRRHRIVVRAPEPVVASLGAVLETVPAAFVPAADAVGVDRKRAAALALIALCAASLCLTLLAGRRARQPLL